MKKLLLLSAIAVTCSTAYGQTTLFEDGFETYNDFITTNIGQYKLFDNDKLGTFIGGVDSPPPGQLPWPNAYTPMACQVFNPSVAGVKNGHENENSNFDPHAASKYLAFWAGSPTAQVKKNDDWLVLPKLTLGSGNKFTFWVKSLADDYGLEQYKVAIYDGVNAPTNTSVFKVVGPASRTAPLNWTEVTVEIPTTYDNKTVYLAINYMSSDSYMMMVDDLKVTAQTVLGLAETTKHITSVYPNPSKGVFKLKSEKKVNSVEVYSADGRLIKNEKSVQLIDITDQPKGVYILKMKYEDGSADSKHILKQ